MGITLPIAKHVKLLENQRHIGFVLHVARHFLLHSAPSCLTELNSSEINRAAVARKVIPTAVWLLQGKPD
jgi:hypothetical protein